MPEPPNGSPARPGVTRREFIQTMGVSAAAGAVQAQTDAPGDAQGGPEIVGPGTTPVTLRINGRDQRVSVEPATTLLDVLRLELGLTGTKEVCDRGSCGACSVLVDGVLVTSCMMLAMDAEGSQITTIEGVAEDGAPDKLQRAFVNHDALQCGYCTPGLVMACRAVLQEHPRPSLDQIKSGLSGNICRCGTYTNVFNAVLDASGQQPRHATRGARHEQVHLAISRRCMPTDQPPAQTLGGDDQRRHLSGLDAVAKVTGRREATAATSYLPNTLFASASSDVRSEQPRTSTPIDTRAGEAPWSACIEVDDRPARRASTTGSNDRVRLLARVEAARWSACDPGRRPRNGRRQAAVRTTDHGTLAGGHRARRSLAPTAREDPATRAPTIVLEASVLDARCRRTRALETHGVVVRPRRRFGRRCTCPRRRARSRCTRRSSVTR